MKIIEEHKVSEVEEPIRIYDYCNGLFEQIPSRKGVKKAIKRGQILLNKEETNTAYWLKKGDVITLIESQEKPPKTYQLELDVFFEDDDIAVVYKPAGLLTSGNQFKTLANALMHNLTSSPKKDALKRPLPTHRLDRATSGLVLIAKTKTARIELGHQFENRSIKKTYHAVVMGKIDEDGEIDQPIDGKPAISHYSPIETVPSLKSSYLTLLKLEPKTGRTHQLRIHLSTKGNAILGDSLYSPKDLKLKGKGLFLSATELKFKHPTKQKEIKLEVDIPKKFHKRMRSEQKRWIKHQLS